MPRIDHDAIPQTNRTGYPEPFAQAVAGRWYRRLGPPSGLTKMGASHVVLRPGAWSSQRHWHDEEDELLVMLTGEAVLVEDGGRTVLRPGDICAWPAGVAEGHQLINESEHDCSFLAISAGNPDGSGGYSDIDMMFDAEGFAHKDGTRYAAKRAG